jgi:hypothetical protein
MDGTSSLLVLRNGSNIVLVIPWSKVVAPRDEYAFSLSTCITHARLSTRMVLRSKAGDKKKTHIFNFSSENGGRPLSRRVYCLLWLQNCSNGRELYAGNRTGLSVLKSVTTYEKICYVPVTEKQPCSSEQQCEQQKQPISLSTPPGGTPQSA